MLKKRKGNSGFTLIELIIVVTILAILVGLLAPNYTKYVKKSKVTKCEAQRAEIEKAYQIGCIEDSALASITDSSGLKLIEQLEDLGYIDAKEAKCPVYHGYYDLVVTTRNHKKIVEVQCGCVNNVLNYISTAMKLFKGNMDKWLSEHKNYDRKYLIKDFYDELGGLPEVPANMKQGTGLEEKTLYWRPYTLKDGKVILYATSQNNDSQGQWRAGIIYKDGKIYQCSEKGKNENPVGDSMDSLKDVSDADFEKWLTDDSKGQKFKLVTSE